MGSHARTESAKQARRQAVLAAALALFDQSSYEAVTMTKVAERAGLAKGTVYLYFETKEELFLSGVQELLGEWFDHLDRLLADGEGPWEPAAFADAITAAMMARPMLPRLLSILHTTLEHNIDRDRLGAFKRFTLDRFARTSPLLERRLPSLAPGEGARLLLQLDALVIGLWHLANAGPSVRDVLDQPGMEPLVIDFCTELGTAVRALLLGYQART